MDERDAAVENSEELSRSRREAAVSGLVKLDHHPRRQTDGQTNRKTMLEGYFAICLGSTKLNV